MKPKIDINPTSNSGASRALLIPGLLGIVPILALFGPAGFVDPNREFAFHFGVDGKPDRFGTLLPEMLNIAGILTLILAIGLVFIFILAKKNGRTSLTVRVLSAMTVGVLAATAAIMLAVVITQINDRDPVAATDTSMLVILLSFIVSGGIFAALCWWLLPSKKSKPSARRRPVESAPVKAKPAEDLVYVTEIEPNRWLVLGIALIGFGLFLLLWLVSDMMVTAVFVGVTFLIVLAFLSWNVTIDSSGVQLKSMMGFPRMKIDMKDINSAGVDKVDPMPDYGGWGVRLGKDERFGIITQKGPALVIGRDNKETDFVITLTDASRAASVLKTLVERRNIDNQTEE